MALRTTTKNRAQQTAKPLDPPETGKRRAKDDDLWAKEVKKILKPERRSKKYPQEEPRSPPVDSDEDCALPEWVIDARGKGEMSDEDVAFWIKASGWTPVEFLTTVYRGPFQKMEHRISAAKAVLEYAHRKLPTKLELEGALNGELKLDASALSKLTDKEIDILAKLLEKAK